MIAIKIKVINKQNQTLNEFKITTNSHQIKLQSQTPNYKVKYVKYDYKYTKLIMEDNIQPSGHLSP